MNIKNKGILFIIAPYFVPLIEDWGVDFAVGKRQGDGKKKRAEALFVYCVLLHKSAWASPLMASAFIALACPSHQAIFVFLL